MRSSYYIRVFFFGYEFLILLAGWTINAFWGDYLAAEFGSIKLNEEAVKWVVVFPISVFGWILKEGVGVLFPDESSLKIFSQWPDYWKLKIHFNVGILYCFLLGIPCLIIWLSDKLNIFEGAFVFVVCVIALSVNAYSFYTAKIHLKSALLRLDGNISNEPVI